MPGDLSAAREKVQQYLTQNFRDVNVDTDGYSLRYGSARLFVRIRTSENIDWTVVTLAVPLLGAVRETPEVFEYIALHADDYTFGHLSASRFDDGLLIMLSHTLLGDYLDEEELCRAIAWMLAAADHLDDELATQFGGNRFHED